MNSEKFLVMLFALFISINAFAWDDCPFGEENDAYPGDCARYVDTDNDGICDYSQPAPEDRIAESTVETNPPDSKEDAAAESAVEKTEIPEGTPVVPAVQGQQDSDQQIQIFSGERYPFILLSAVLIALYGASWIASRKGKISIVAHRKIWNVLLFLTFIVSGFIGLMLVMRINYGFKIPNYAQMLYWHVEFGIAMALISVFHILWHIPYFKCLLGSGKEKKVCD